MSAVRSPGPVRYRRFQLQAASVCLALACAGLGHAQDDGLGSSSATTASGGEAGEHFDRGVAYYEDGDYRAALLEFQRAYELQHAYQLLYNLGQVAAELRDYAGAEEYFRRYLEDGGSAIADDRRSEVKAELNRLRARVGSVRVTGELSGAEVRVDDRVIDDPDSGAIRVSAGRRQIVAEKSGYLPVRRSIDVLGGEETSVEIAFGPPIAQTAGSSGSDAPKASASDPWPWVTGISSAALLIGAGAIGYWAYQDSSALSARLNQYTTQAELDQLASQARSKAIVADVLLGTAVAGAVLTTVLLLTSREHEATELSARPKSRVGLSATGVRVQF